jgi:xanthine dehydrogenase molybdopterin-binding subunit B
LTGWAAYTAAQEIKRQMCERAAKTWNVPVEQVTGSPYKIVQVVKFSFSLAVR